MRAAFAAAVLALASCAPADPAQVADNIWDECDAGVFTLERVTACSQVIDSENSSDERRALALINRGILRGELGQDARAIADFGRALRIDPDNALAYLERGYVHHNRGAYETAVRDYEHALALQPDLQLAASRRDEALVGRSRTLMSNLALLDRRLAADPDNADLLNSRCWLRATHDDDLALALADCNESLRIEPNAAHVLDSRGLVHLKRGDFASAETDYAAAFAAAPERGHYLYGRGLARIGLGRKAEGAADLAEGERLEPGVAALYRGYGAQAGGERHAVAGTQTQSYR